MKKLYMQIYLYHCHNYSIDFDEVLKLNIGDI